MSSRENYALFANQIKGHERIKINIIYYYNTTTRLPLFNVHISTYKSERMHHFHPSICSPMNAWIKCISKWNDIYFPAHTCCTAAWQDGIHKVQLCSVITHSSCRCTSLNNSVRFCAFCATKDIPLTYNTPTRTSPFRIRMCTMCTDKSTTH